MFHILQLQATNSCDPANFELHTMTLQNKKTMHHNLGLDDTKFEKTNAKSLNLSERTHTTTL